MNIESFKNNLLVLICAKGNSKGVKEKSLKIVGNKSLLGHAILKARYCDFNYVCLSTESDKVKKEAKKYGLESFFKRSIKLTKTNISKEEVWIDALLRSEKFFQKKFNYILDIDLTNPMLSNNDLNLFLDISFKKLTTGWNGIFCSTLSRKNPYFNILKKNKLNGYSKCSHPNNSQILSRQKAPKTYDHVAGFYCFKRSYLFQKKNFLLENKIFGYPLPLHKSFDIDTDEDLELVKNLYSKYRNK